MLLSFKDMCWINFIVSEVVVFLLFACNFKFITGEISKAIKSEGEVPSEETFTKITTFIGLVVIASVATYFAVSIPVSGACTIYNRTCFG